MDSVKFRRVLVILILVLIAMVAGVTYAYFNLLVSKEKDSTKLKTGTLDVSYEQGNIIYEEKFYPRKEPSSLDDNEFVYINNFTVTNTGTLDGYLTIKLNVIENEFPDNNLKYNIYNSLGQVFISGYVNSTDSYVLADNIFIKASKSAQYTIQIWLEENGKQQNASAGKKLTAAIEVIEEQISS